MAQQETQGNELSFELLKNTQQIAEQAAVKAKEIAMRSTTGKVPEIPLRGGGEQQRAPEIPPKRLSLKKIIGDENVVNGSNDGKPIPVPQRNQVQKPPPPIPQKPSSSAQNSPRLSDKMIHSPAVTTTGSTTIPSSHMTMGMGMNLPQQQQQMFHERVSQSPQLSAKNQNIVNILNSPLFQQRANQYKMQQQQQQSHLIRQQQTKPADEDFGSEDALRGIERGLKNMERAMKEQMTMRNLDFADGKSTSEMQFNPMEFKRSLGGSFNSLDGPGQNIRMGVGNMRLNFDGQAWGQRAIERNFSMDQMRLEALQGGPMKNIPIDFSQQQTPKHNIYRSLDRTLPLELQFSRHRQQQQQELEFMRQNNQNLNQRQQQQQQQQAMSREDLNLRRRSSHDETQYIMHQQQQKQTTGNSAANANIDNSSGKC